MSNFFKPVMGTWWVTHGTVTGQWGTWWVTHGTVTDQWTPTEFPFKVIGPVVEVVAGPRRGVCLGFEKRGQAEHQWSALPRAVVRLRRVVCTSVVAVRAFGQWASEWAVHVRRKHERQP
jgi:hypothetical protein